MDSDQLLVAALAAGVALNLILDKAFKAVEGLLA